MAGPPGVGARPARRARSHHRRGGGGRARRQVRRPPLRRRRDDPTARPPATDADLVARGEELYLTSCVSCHGVGGAGTDLGPSLLDVGRGRGRLLPPHRSHAARRTRLPSRPTSPAPTTTTRSRRSSPTSARSATGPAIPVDRPVAGRPPGGRGAVPLQLRGVPQLVGDRWRAEPRELRAVAPAHRHAADRRGDADRAGRDAAVRAGRVHRPAGELDRART